MQNEEFQQNQSDMNEQERMMDEKQEITRLYDQPNPLIVEEDKKAKDKLKKREEKRKKTGKSDTERS
jgi:hypothetical protein